MVCGAFCANGTTELAFLKHIENAEDYLNTLETCMLLYENAFRGKNFKFMQDGVNILTVRTCKECFNALNIDVTTWAAKSSD